MCTVSFPAWLLGLNPYLEIMCASYSQSLGEDFSRLTREVMDAEFYKRSFDTRLAREKRAAHQFETTLGGQRLTTSVTCTVTGRGGGIIILDDFVRRQDIWRNLRRGLVEVRPRLGVDVRRRACGAASGDVRWSVA